MSIFDAVAHPKQFFVNRYVNNTLKNAAEGQYGEKVKAAYWWTHNHATWIGLSLGAVQFGLLGAGALGCAQCAHVNTWLVTLAGFLTTSGLAVGFHAAEAPQKG